MTISARPIQHATGPSHGGPLRLATLSMAADKDSLALARTSATYVGEFLALPTARIADLRLAVNEACACFLDTAARRVPRARGVGRSSGGSAAAPTAAMATAAMADDTMELSYDRYPAELHVTVRAAIGDSWPAANALGWEVLRAVVGDVRLRIQDGLGVLTLIQPLPARGV